MSNCFTLQLYNNIMYPMPIINYRIYVCYQHETDFFYLLLLILNSGYEKKSFYSAKRACALFKQLILLGLNLAYRPTAQLI